MVVSRMIFIMKMNIRLVMKLWFLKSVGLIKGFLWVSEWIMNRYKLSRVSMVFS